MDYVSRSIVWRRTGDGEFPYSASVDGVDLRLRVNDFPAEPLYTLFVDFRPLIDLDDWPGVWLRPAPSAEELRAGGEAQRRRGIVDAIVVADWAYRLCISPSVVLEEMGVALEDGVARLPWSVARADLDALLGPSLTAAPDGAPFTCEVVVEEEEGEGGLLLVRRAVEGRPTTPSSERT